MQQTSNNNIRFTYTRKRIFCCVSFLLLRSSSFCKSFTSNNLHRSLQCGAIFLTTDYCIACATGETKLWLSSVSSTLAQRLNWGRACTVLLSNPILIKFGTVEGRCMNRAFSEPQEITVNKQRSHIYVLKESYLNGQRAGSISHPLIPKEQIQESF